MLKASVTPKEMCDFLNSLLKLDRKAITSLTLHRVNCNTALAKHPTVQVTRGNHMVGLLGVLNGLFGVNANGYGCITVELESDESGKQSVKKFTYSETLGNDAKKSEI